MVATLVLIFTEFLKIAKIANFVATTIIIIIKKYNNINN